MGDALAIALLERRGFRVEDFAALHPAGSIGRRFMKVEDLMHTGDAVPRVSTDTPMKDVIVEITAKRLGVAGVFIGKGKHKLAGVITDGDLRRALSEGDNILNKRVRDVMNRSPKLIPKGSLAEAALRMMEEHSITSLFVYDGDNGAVIGVVHMHDLVKAGVI